MSTAAADAEPPEDGVGRRSSLSKWQSAKTKATIVNTFTKLPVPDPPGKYDADILGVAILQDSTGQHTIAWKSDIVGDNGVVLPAGEINLYRYPRCNLGARIGVLPEEAQLALLDNLLVASASPQEHVFFRRDPSGACPIHAILIANNAEALTLVLRLYAHVPSLLMQTHGPGFFVGESGLHVLAANRREEELCEALDIADRLLTTPQLVELLCVQAAGDFFRSPPSLFYGGTIMGYAAAFNLKDAVRKMMQNDRVAAEVDLLNASDCACKITGFLPLHAAAANGMCDMVDFLVFREPVPAALDGVEPLPEDRRADKNKKTSQGEKLTWAGLSTLQLAAKLGDERMCKHILRTRLSINWKWGPLTSLSLSLHEIESAYEADAGLMELVAHFEARPATQAMLLDDFLQGFLHELFVQKWHRFGKYLFYTLRLIDLIFLGLQLILAFRLKGTPLWRNVELAFATQAIATLIALYEVWVVRLWWRNEFGGQESSSGNLKYKINGMRSWASGFGVGRRIISCILTVVGCALYVEAAPRADAIGTADEALWTLFALGASFQTHAVISSIFVSPNIQELGIYSITIERMFAHDVKTFLIFLTAFMLKYWIAMYISFPRAGETQLPEIAPFDDPYKAFKAVLDSAIYQKRWGTNWDAIDSDTFSPGHWVAITLFSYFHLMFAITCLILLVRLLMAMMTNTFQSVRKMAQLEWRLLIARHVLRLELQFDAFAKTFCLPASAAQRKFSGVIPPGGKEYVHTFLHVERSPDAPDAVPLLLAKQGGNDLYDAEEQKAAAILQATREARVKQARNKAASMAKPAGGIMDALKKSGAVGAAAVGGPSGAAAETDAKAAVDREQMKALLKSALSMLESPPPAVMVQQDDTPASPAVVTLAAAAAAAAATSTTPPPQGAGGATPDDNKGGSPPSKGSPTNKLRNLGKRSSSNAGQR